MRGAGYGFEELIGEHGLRTRPPSGQARRNNSVAPRGAGSTIDWATPGKKCAATSSVSDREDKGRA
jgi:hypothetical protein